MNRALVVYESMFGNAQAIAHAVAAGMSSEMTADVVEVGEAPDELPPGLTLFVVGGPTHMLATTRPSSRRRASRKIDRPLVSRGVGLREYLRQLRGVAKLPAAVFDTRLVRPRWLRLFRSAAPKVEARLRALGFEILLPAESFFVADETGPLLPHELERARAWGTALARAQMAHPPFAAGP